MAPIQHAVLPVAGLGTRFLPATKASPKEMLPVVDKPLIQYGVEEALAAGLKEIAMVTGRGNLPTASRRDPSPSPAASRGRPGAVTAARSRQEAMQDKNVKARGDAATAKAASAST